MLEIVRTNIASPPVLAFAGGVAAVLAAGTLRLPRSMYTVLSRFLLFGIGLKGGIALAKTPVGSLWRPAIGTVLLGVATTLAAFAVLQRLGKLQRVDAAAVAAHYGSVSAVTFTAGLAFLTAAGVPFEGFMPTLVVLLEIPAIAVGLLIARAGDGGGRREALREVFLGSSVVMLVLGTAAGGATGAAGITQVPKEFTTLFIAALTLFLLDMGMAAAARLRELRGVGGFLAGFALVVPLVQGTVGVFLGDALGLSVGGATIFGVMAASASYIAATAAVQIALPEANPALYITPALGITFPFNLTVGIPAYHAIARWLQ